MLTLVAYVLLAFAVAFLIVCFVAGHYFVMSAFAFAFLITSFVAGYYYGPRG